MELTFLNFAVGIVCFVIAYNFNGKYAPEAGKTRMRTAFFTRAEEGKTRGVGNDSHSIKWRWGEHRQRQNPQRRLTLEKVTESKKTGSEGSGELTELDETILDILGRESANIEPVKVEDFDIVFGEEKIVTTTPSAEGKIIIILCK